MQQFSFLLLSFLLGGCGFQKGYYERVSGIPFPRSYKLIESYDNGEFLTITSLQIDSVALQVFIQKHGLKKIEKDFELYELRGASYLQYQKPSLNHPLYGLVGDNGKTNCWIYVADLSQQILWAEIQYPDWSGDSPVSSFVDSSQTLPKPNPKSSKSP